MTGVEHPAPTRMALCTGEEIVHSRRKRRGEVNPLVVGSNPTGPKPTSSVRHGQTGNRDFVELCMSDLGVFPITRKWPPQHPDRLQLYSLPTPNGVKVSLMLEETGLPYEPHLVNFDTNDQATPEFRSLNPDRKS